MSALEIVLLCLYAVLFATGGWRVGVYKGYPWSGGVGAAAGLILGPLGILAMALIPSSPAAAQQRERGRLHAERLAEEAERRTREEEDLALSGQPRRSPLRQIDTDDAGWMWGGPGTIYYWIRRQDLTAGNFDRTWMIFQCS